MPTFEMVCLANSRKRKGRCVAGLRTDGQGWIRPVGSNAEGILHPYHYTLHNNTEAQVLDVLRVDCSRAQPAPHHPEDWVAQPVSWRLISRPVSVEQTEWLRSHLASGPHLLGCTQDKIAHRVLQARPATHSLALIAPQNLQWLVKIGSDGERKVRATFGLDGAEYNLALTDPLWENRLQHLPTGLHARSEARLKAGDDVWLTVSLSEPFAPDGGDEEHCYKLAAAVIVVPHTNKANGATSGGSPNSKVGAGSSGATGADKAGAEQADAITKPAFPTNPASEKTLHSRRLLPDLSAYPDPFANEEPEQTAPPIAFKPTPQAAPNRKEASTHTETANANGVSAETINKAAVNKAAPDVSKPNKKTRIAAPPQIQPDDVSTLSIPQEADTPRPTMPQQASAENILEADVEAKPTTRFDKLRQKVPRAFMRWTSEEDAALLEQMQAGGSIESIAVQMQRHEGAVRKRLEKFGLIESEDAPTVSLQPETQASPLLIEPPTKTHPAAPSKSAAQVSTIQTELTSPPQQSADSIASARTLCSSPAPQGGTPGDAVASETGTFSVPETDELAAQRTDPAGTYSLSGPQVRPLSRERRTSPAPARKAQTDSVIRVIVCGAAGRMGREVVKAVVEAEGLHLVAAVDVSSIGSDAGELAGMGKIGVVIESQLAPALERWTPDVLVDFTLPDSVKRNAIVSLEHGVSPVIGTTGLSASDLSTLDALAKEQGIGAFIAPNFAIGAVLAMQFAAQAARYLPDVEIIELHHEKKLDSPSGTALLTAQKIAAARQESGVSPLPTPANTIEKASGARGARHTNTGDIPVHSVRLPGFVAHQEVIFGGQGEILTIRHDSIHRSSFMPGVVVAVRKVRALDGLVIGLENLLT